MMNLDIYSMAATQRVELERALRRQERLRQAGVTSGPSVMSRLGGLAHRFAGRERVVRRAATSATPISCLTTRMHEPV